MTTADQPDPAEHPDLAGLAPAPLLEHERMDAAAARLSRVTDLHVPTPPPMRMALIQLTGALREGARMHRHDDDHGPGPCPLAQIADALLGNEVRR